MSFMLQVGIFKCLLPFVLLFICLMTRVDGFLNFFDTAWKKPQYKIS